MTIQLKGGQTTESPLLDRLVQFDDRSRAFSVGSIIEQVNPRSYTWGCDQYNDQGREGACVGFAWSHELSARPAVIRAEHDIATRIYKRAQQIDQWPGEAYSGTSVIAGAKAVQELKTSSGKQIMTEYRWAFGLEDLVMALSWRGPAVLGVAWYEGMWRPDAEGLLHPTGPIVGGHAILARGVKIVKVNPDEPSTWSNVNYDKSTVLLHNSWGKDWGVAGNARITFTELRALLREQGEACIPVTRLAKK